MLLMSSYSCNTPATTNHSLNGIPTDEEIARNHAKNKEFELTVDSLKQIYGEGRYNKMLAASAAATSLDELLTITNLF
jgi:hypothetical protein